MKWNNFILPKTASDIWDFVASRLAGHRCKVHLQTPFIPGMWGTATKIKNIGHIFIAPYLVGGDRDRLVEVFCHECAHQRLHFAGMYNYQNQPTPLTTDQYNTWVAVAELFGRMNVKRIELEAQTLAASWYAYSKLHSHEVPNHGDLAKLIILLEVI